MEKIQQKLIDRRPTYAETTEEVRNNLKISSSMRHRIVRVYPDGTHFENDTDCRNAAENVAYNLMYRGEEAAILMDGIIVHLGSFSKPRLMQKLLLLSEKGVQFELTPSDVA